MSVAVASITTMRSFGKRPEGIGQATATPYFDFGEETVKVASDAVIVRGTQGPPSACDAAAVAGEPVILSITWVGGVVVSVKPEFPLPPQARNEEMTATITRGPEQENRTSKPPTKTRRGYHRSQ